MGNKYGRTYSDHNIIKYKIEQENNNGNQYKFTGKRYSITEGKYKRIDYKLKEEFAKEFRMEGEEDLERLDNRIAKHTKEIEDIEFAIEKLHKAITLSCDKTVKAQREGNEKIKQKSVPWWTAEITTKIKRLNALRRRYQRK